MKLVVTVARELGCGGSYVGNRIAQTLGLRYVDREVLKLTAESFEMEEADLEHREERVDSFWDRLAASFTFGVPGIPEAPPLTAMLTDTDIFQRECEVMARLAAEGDCVVVGRAGALVLPPTPGTINIFLRAPEEFRIQRVMEHYHAATRAQAKEWIRQSDEARDRYVQQMTGHDWHCSRNYHACLDSSLMPLDDLGDLLVEMIRRTVAGREEAAA